MTYNLSPYISPEDVCSVGAVVYGSNDVGGCLPVNITLGSTYPPLVQPRDNVSFPYRVLSYNDNCNQCVFLSVGNEVILNIPAHTPTHYKHKWVRIFHHPCDSCRSAGVPSHVANLVAFSNLSSAAVALMVIVLVTVVTSIFIARRFKNGGNHTNTLSKIFTYVFSLQVKSV